MASFWEWEEFSGWKVLHVPVGIYKVSLEGVQLKNEDTTVYGYDLILKTVDKVGVRDLEPRSDSRLY